jgi:hypothetical protein
MDGETKEGDRAHTSRCKRCAEPANATEQGITETHNEKPYTAAGESNCTEDQYNFYLHFAIGTTLAGRTRPVRRAAKLRLASPSASNDRDKSGYN